MERPPFLLKSKGWMPPVNPVNPVEIYGVEPPAAPVGPVEIYGVEFWNFRGKDHPPRAYPYRPDEGTAMVAVLHPVRY